MRPNINIENYEAFWVDYLDGNLTPEQEEALFGFLENNPDIAGSLIDVEDYKIPAGKIEFPGKSKLFAENQTEMMLISKLENSISAEDDKFITEKISSEEKIAHSYSLYKKTILVPDNAIVFPDKNSLKKTVRVPMFRYAGSIAAAVAVVFVAGYFLTRNTVNLDSGTPALTSDLDFNMPVIKINNDTDTLNTNIIEDPDIYEYTANSFTDNGDHEQNVTVYHEIEIPAKLPLQQAKTLNYRQSFSSTRVMEYRYDVPADNMAYSYTMQYTRTKEENRLFSGLKKLVRAGEEIDVKQKWEEIKIKKEEFLYTSLDR